MISIIELVLSLLSNLLPQLTSNKVAPEIIADVEAAINSLKSVQSTPVTYGQLESLRVKMTW